MPFSVCSALHGVNMYIYIRRGKKLGFQLSHKHPHTFDVCIYTHFDINKNL